MYSVLKHYMYVCTSTHIYIHVTICSFLSLCKKFSQYAFLWEQDVISTFNSFLNGVAEPHPRHFTRPETVCRSRSASHSARPRRYLVMHNVFSFSSTHSSSFLTSLSSFRYLFLLTSSSSLFVPHLPCLNSSFSTSLPSPSPTCTCIFILFPFFFLFLLYFFSFSSSSFFFSPSSSSNSSSTCSFSSLLPLPLLPPSLLPFPLSLFFLD